MRILVIGGTGLTGPHTVRRLSELGHEIVVFHRGDTEAELPRRVGHIHGDRKDLSDFAAEFARFAPRIVVDMIPRNAQDAWSVVAAFKDIAQRVVALSSQDVYRAYGVLRGVESGPIEPIPLTEVQTALIRQHQDRINAILLEALSAQLSRKERE